MSRSGDRRVPEHPTLVLFRSHRSASGKRANALGSTLFATVLADADAEGRIDWSMVSVDGRNSQPPLCRLDTVSATGVERDGGLRRVAADQVHDLLEQRKQWLCLADPAPYHHDIPRVPGQRCDEGGLGRFIEHDQCHGCVDALLAEPGQFRVESRAKSLTVHARYRLRVVTNNKCRRHAGNLPGPAGSWCAGQALAGW